MKYLCLICADTWMEKMPEDERGRHFDEYRDFTDELRAGGQLVVAHRLQPPETATTVRVRNGRVSTTDGPYAETKEQAGGFYVIEARDLNDALRVASRIPGARYGCVEVRPIAEDASTRHALRIGESNGSRPSL